MINDNFRQRLITLEEIRPDVTERSAGDPVFADTTSPDGAIAVFADDPLARASEILYQVAQSAKDEGRLVFAGQVIAARKIVQGLREFAEE